MERKERVKKPVIGFDKDTLEIKLYFYSTYEAGKNGYSQVQITNICNHIRYCKSCKGLAWMYESEWVELYGRTALDEFLEREENDK